MSLEAITRVLAHSQAPSTQKLVLVVLADFQGFGAAFPSLETIAKRANVSKRTAQYAIRDLEESGELFIEERTGRNNTNSYYVLTECPEECDKTNAHRELKGARYDSKGCKIEQERVQPVAHKPYKPYKPIYAKEEKTPEQMSYERRLRELQAQAIVEESTRAKRNAAPAPICKHGKILVLCVECCKTLTN